MCFASVKGLQNISSSFDTVVFHKMARNQLGAAFNKKRGLVQNGFGLGK